MPAEIDAVGPQTTGPHAVRDLAFQQHLGVGRQVVGRDQLHHHDLRRAVLREQQAGRSFVLQHRCAQLGQIDLRLLLQGPQANTCRCPAGCS